MKPIRALVYTPVLALALVSGGHAQPAAVASTKEAVAATQTPAAPASRAELVAEIAKRFDDPNFANAFFGVHIESLDTGEVWYDRNGGKLFLPASNEKILTTSSALMFLGPDFTFTTLVKTNGKITEGVLDGDLVIWANGDPTLYDRFFKEPQEVWRGWAKQLKDMGVTHITGNIIGDDNAWDDTHTGNGWPADDLVPYYYAEYGPLTFNENYVDVKITPPATLDGKVELTPNVASDYFHLNNQVKVVEKGSNNVELSRGYGSNDITLSGTVVAGSKPLTESPSITNPTLWYVTALRETLEKEGIRVDGRAEDIDDIKEAPAATDAYTNLIEYHSPPLRDIVEALMQRSQNMYAETMVYTMGWKDKGLGSFRNGREVVHRELATLGIDPDSYQYSDGSGLSRYDYVSPDILTKIYAGMLKGPLAEDWRNAQSIAGKIGTLRNRMKGTAAEGNMRGKTGTISNVRSLSGFVKTAGGEELVLSFLCNGHMRSSSDLDPIYDGVVELLANFDGGKAPAGKM